MNSTIKTQNVFVFRHGPYEGPGFITPAGRTQLERMGRLLREVYGLTEANTTTLCSAEIRAVRSVYSLAEGLGFEKTDELAVHKTLFSSDRVCDVEAALKAVEPSLRTHENVIIVTHCEMTGRLTSALREKFCGLEAVTPGLKHSECWAIDLITEGVERLKPQMGTESPA